MLLLSNSPVVLLSAFVTGLRERTKYIYRIRVTDPTGGVHQETGDFLHCRQNTMNHGLLTNRHTDVVVSKTVRCRLRTSQSGGEVWLVDDVHLVSLEL